MENLQGKDRRETDLKQLGARKKKRYLPMWDPDRHNFILVEIKNRSSGNKGYEIATDEHSSYEGGDTE